HRRARALAEEDEGHRGPAGATRREGVLVADAAAELPGAARVGHDAPVEVADRRVQLLALGVRPARDDVRDLAADVDAVLLRPSAGGAGERVVERRDEELAVGGQPVRLDVRVAAVPDGGRAVAVALARA